VFGAPDPKFGEEVCAWVIARAGQSLSEDEVREFCRGQIAHYKVPRHRARSSAGAVKQRTT
jgi:fatty-acyl-CoA synthase